MTDKLVITLQRTHENNAGDATFGKIYADGAFVCYSLEDKVRESEQSVAAWKIKGKTAIPSTDHPSLDDMPGYRVTLEHSPRFGPETLTLSAVPATPTRIPRDAHCWARQSMMTELWAARAGQP